MGTRIAEGEERGREARSTLKRTKQTQDPGSSQQPHLGIGKLKLKEVMDLFKSSFFSKREGNSDRAVGVE